MPHFWNSFVCFLPQTTAQTAANKQDATVPAPSAAAALAAEAATVNQVDPERAKQLTQAVAEQVRSLADGKCNRLAIPSEPDSHFFFFLDFVN